MNRHLLRFLTIFLLIASTLLLSRCISANEKDLVKYDAAADNFHMLIVLTDIKANDADDLDYLEAIYKNRDHLIAPIFPGGANLFPMLGISALRAGDNQFSILNLFGPRPGDFDLTKSTTSLKDITITPGTFFLQNGALGYYQAVTVPGKTIDSALAEISQAPTSEMQKGIDAEIQRRTAGGITHTWAQLKEETLKKIALDEKPPENNDEPINPLTVLDADSLKILKQALAEKSLKLARDKTAISFALPLSAPDAAAAADLINALTKRLDEVITSTKLTPQNADQIQMARGMQAALTALTLTPGNKGLTVSADILKFAQASAGLPPHRVDMNEKEKPLGPGEAAPEKAIAPDPIAFLKDKKIPLDDKLTAEQIIKDFNAGTLKAYPSATPVKPGEGIIKPKDAPNAMP